MTTVTTMITVMSIPASDIPHEALRRFLALSGSDAAISPAVSALNHARTHIYLNARSYPHQVERVG